MIENILENVNGRGNFEISISIFIRTIYVSVLVPLYAGTFADAVKTMFRVCIWDGYVKGSTLVCSCHTIPMPKNFE